MNIVRQSCMIESSVPDQNGQSLTDEGFLERNIDFKMKVVNASLSLSPKCAITFQT